MGFRKLNVKAKAKSGRGCMDAQLIEEALIDSWELLSATLEENEDVKDEITEHFNNINEDYDNLGDILFGDAAAFKSALDQLTATEKMAYFNELFE